MSLAVIHSRALHALDAAEVTVEVDRKSVV